MRGKGDSQGGGLTDDNNFPLLICTGHLEARRYSNSFGQKGSHFVREELKKLKDISETCCGKINLLRQRFGLREARSPNTFLSNSSIYFY